MIPTTSVACLVLPTGQERRRDLPTVTPILIAEDVKVLGENKEVFKARWRTGLYIYIWIGRGKGVGWKEVEQALELRAVIRPVHPPPPLCFAGKIVAPKPHSDPLKHRSSTPSHESTWSGFFVLSCRRVSLADRQSGSFIPLETLLTTLVSRCYTSK